mgnify:FL=1
MQIYKKRPRGAPPSMWARVALSLGPILSFSFVYICFPAFYSAPCPARRISGGQDDIIPARAPVGRSPDRLHKSRQNISGYSPIPFDTRLLK